MSQSFRISLAVVLSLALSFSWSAAPIGPDELQQRVTDLHLCRIRAELDEGIARGRAQAEPRSILDRCGVDGGIEA